MEETTTPKTSHTIVFDEYNFCIGSNQYEHLQITIDNTDNLYESNDDEGNEFDISCIHKLNDISTHRTVKYNTNVEFTPLYSMSDFENGSSDEKLVEDQIYQQKERDRRQSNIIVYGVDESKKEAPKERFREDKETVAEFMEKELKHMMKSGAPHDKVM